jgi:raffinose/stachyose/melibiose transport system permease protein
MSTKNTRLIERKVSNTNRIILIVLSVLFAYLIFFAVITSLKTLDEFYENIWALPKGFEIQNYIDAWIKGNLGQLFFNSLLIVGMTVIIILILASLTGYALARLNLPFSKTILALILVCMVPPPEAVFVPAYLLAHKIIGNGNYLSMIMPYAAWGLPSAVFIYYTFFKSLPGELIESARIEGCTEMQTFRHIAIPLMVPATGTVSIMAFVGWWGELLWASVNLSASSLRTLPLGVITFTGIFGAQWGQFAAAITIVLIPLIIFFIFTQKYFIRGLMGGAVKG